MDKRQEVQREVLALQQYDKWLAAHMEELVGRSPSKVVAIHQDQIVFIGDAEADALMSTESMLKEQLVRELARLPEERLHEVLRFVESLLHQEQQTGAETLLQERDPEQDPLLQYSGGVAHGSLASNIDQKLYGT